MRRILSASLALLLPTIACALRTLKAAVIMPGFLNDEAEFKPLAAALTARGIPTAVVPMKTIQWLPQVGGRSVRPMLERIDHAVRHVAALGDAAEATTQKMLSVPPIDYSLADIWTDFRTNPGGPFAVGGSQNPDEFPDVTPRGTFEPAREPQGRVALIGHSAAGWMARIYLSTRAYGGKAYAGADLVHSLVTLGTPHIQGVGVPFVSVGWANREPVPLDVRCLAVGGRGLKGDRSGELTEKSYDFCTPEGTGGALLDGDGTTTIESAIGLPGVETLVLDDCTHLPWSDVPFGGVVAPELAKAHREGLPWYGDEQMLDQWVPWLLEACARDE